MIAPFRYTLSTLLTLLEQKPRWNSSEKQTFHWITTSTLEVKPGSLFVPLRATRDGHMFIQEALDKGAMGYLYEPNNPYWLKLSPEAKAKGIPTKNSLHALAKIARFHRRRFSPILIGITGSSGKTTTKDLVGNLFSFLPKSELVITEENYNNEIGVPFTLFRITERTRVVVCEMGMNHRHEIQRLSLMAEPTHTLITTIGSAHIENLKSRENIAEEKSDIILGMMPGGTLFVPDDIAFVSLIKRKTKKHKVDLQLWPHKRNPKLKIQTTLPEGFTLLYNGETVPWKLPGEKILSNVRGMVTIGEYFGVTEDQIRNAIQTYKSPKKRLNVIKGYFSILDDTYNANPESMLSSIEAAIQYAGKKPLACVLGSMKELGKFTKYYHEEIASYLEEKGVKNVFVLGEEMKHVAKKCKSAVWYSSKEKLIAEVPQKLSRGTVILIKGSRSMKMEECTQNWSRIKG